MEKSLVTIVIGTRPEAIKLCPLVIAFKKSNKLKSRIILTGQHNEMVLNILDLFNIKEDLNLDILKKGQDLIDIDYSVKTGLRNDFKQNKPSLLVVQGDTSSAFSAAMTGFFFKVPVAHVEAGLRTNNLYEPFPEESNRRLISQISSLHFAPTELAAKNLRKAGVTGQIFITGNTVIDALKMKSNYANVNGSQNLEFDDKKMIFVTVHRRENWGKNLVKISQGIKLLLENNSNINILISLHPNEEIREVFRKYFEKDERVTLSEPLNYINLIKVLQKATLILTDSGGLQEEAPTFGKPVLVLRETTERPEAIEAGTSKLVGTDPDNIYNNANLLLNSENNYKAMAKAVNPFGDGKASQIILKKCIEFLNI